MRCNIRSVKSTLRSLTGPLNDPYGSNELNKPSRDRYNAGILDSPKPVETSGVYFGSLKTFFISVNLKHSHRLFSQHIGYSELENIRQIDIFMHVAYHPETMPMSRMEKKPCSIKAFYRVEDRPTYICLKMTFT